MIFAITVAETLIATWEGRADRQSTYVEHNRFSLKAAHWATLFELVLFIDILVIVHEGLGVIVPILLGAWLGKYYALEKRRKKWLVKRFKKKAEVGDDEDGKMVNDADDTSGDDL